MAIKEKQSRGSVVGPKIKRIYGNFLRHKKTVDKYNIKS